jgi:hypothetical protein
MQRNSSLGLVAVRDFDLAYARKGSKTAVPGAAESCQLNLNERASDNLLVGRAP